MVRSFPLQITYLGGGNEATPMKDVNMTKQSSIQSPTQADVEMYIARARQMRADYIARSLKTGFVSLRDLFSSKSSTAKTPA
jgi:hypothetical protein